MRTLTLICATLSFMLSGAAMAADKELDELNMTVFQTVDANEDGKASAREVDYFRDLVMLSMDSNDDEKVTLMEYMMWDLGWADLAEKRDKLDQYRQARADVFEVWDRDGDGSLSLSEQKLSQAQDFYSATDASNEPMDVGQFSTRLRIMAAMNEAVAGGEPVTLINVFTVPGSKLEEAVTFWEEGASFMRRQPGYVSTALHQTVLPDAKFALINIAKWESVEAFKAASVGLRTKSGVKPIDGVTFDASLYKVIRSD